MKIRVLESVIANSRQYDIIEVKDDFNCVRYRVKQGSRYLGKTKDGGYKTRFSAMNYITNQAGITSCVTMTS